MLPNLSTLALSPGNVLVRCPECASLFRKNSPTGCVECGGKRKREEEEKEKDDCSCKKECACDDDKMEQSGLYRYQRMYPDADPNSDEGRLIVSNFVADEDEDEDLKPAFRSTVADEDDDAVPDPNDPNMSEQWRNAYWYARGVSTGRLGMDSPEQWQVEAAKRKLAELDEGPPPIVVPEPGDPNMDAQWKNAYLKARGISYGSLSAGNEGEDNPEPWQIEAARRKLAPQDRGPPQPEEADDPDQPAFKSGCTDDDCVQMFSHGCTEDDCEPQFQSLGADPNDSEDEAPASSLSLSDARDEFPYPPYASISRLQYEKPAKFRSAGEEKEEEEEEEEEEKEKEEESEDESEGEGDDVGDWRDDANFDYYRAVGRPPYTP